MVKYIYKVSQTCIEGNDTYDSAVVIAKNEKEAIDVAIRKLSHGGTCFPTNADYVNCEKIGKADSSQESYIVVASFNAG